MRNLLFAGHSSKSLYSGFRMRKYPIPNSRSPIIAKQRVSESSIYPFNFSPNSVLQSKNKLRTNLSIVTKSTALLMPLPATDLSLVVHKEYFDFVLIVVSVSLSTGFRK